MGQSQQKIMEYKTSNKHYNHDNIVSECMKTKTDIAGLRKVISLVWKSISISYRLQLYKISKVKKKMMVFSSWWVMDKLEEVFPFFVIDYHKVRFQVKGKGQVKGQIQLQRCSNCAQTPVRLKSLSSADDKDYQKVVSFDLTILYTL